MTELIGAQRPRVAGLEGYRCFETPYGWIFTKDSAALDDALGGLAQATQAFAHDFQTPVRHGALVLVDGMAVPGLDGIHLLQALKAAGAAWALPWPDYASPAVVDALRQQLVSAIGNPQAAEPIVQNVLARAPETMRHELGHVLFVNTFWPSYLDHPQPERYYSGPGADWLDETAAILMEGPILSRERRAAFWQAYRAGDHERIRPLATFFTMDHPDFTAQHQGGQSSPGTGAGTSPRLGVTVRNSGGMGTEQFYAECRVFADFLLARTQDSTVLHSIAESEVHGTHMAAWLHQHGSQYHLPTTVAALEQEWQQWLQDGADKAEETP